MSHKDETPIDVARAAICSIGSYDVSLQDHMQKRLDAALAAPKSAGLCMYCGWSFKMIGDSPEVIQQVYKDTLDHDQVCPKNPLVKRIQQWQLWAQYANAEYRKATGRELPQEQAA